MTTVAPEVLAAMTKTQRWRALNPEKYQESKKKSDKKYYDRNKGSIRKTQAEYKHENQEALNKQSQRINKERLKTDTVFKLTCLMRTRIGNHLRGKCKKGGVTFKLIGCTPEQLQAHLGDGEAIDHIFPLVRYDATHEQHKMTNWQNLQMLTRLENSDKRDQLPTKAMAAKVPAEFWPSGITSAMLPDIYVNWKTPLNMN